MFGDCSWILVGWVVFATALVALVASERAHVSGATMQLLQRWGDDDGPRGQMSRPGPVTQAAGCWRSFVGYNSGFSEITLALSPSGSYRRTHVVSTTADGAPASNINKTKGRWTLAGSTLTLARDDQPGRDYEVSHRAGTLIVGAQTYLPCR